ncbi:MAG: cell division protein FtsX, partial [Bacteroidia bacterium]
DKVTSKKVKSSNITVIISLSLVLFMLGALGLLITNANKLTKHFKENVGFQVFLKDTATSSQIDQLILEINNSPYAKSVSFITKEQAAEELKVSLGEDFISFLGKNPLLNAVDVKINADYAVSDTLQNIEKQLVQRSFIKEVIYQKDMIDSLNKNTRAIAFFILIFSGALILVAVALINNTIRLSIYSQRFLIRTMYLVGATRGFISKPFIFKGIRQGVTAAIIAGFLLGGFLVVSTRFIPDLLQLQDENLLALLFGGLVILGIFISGLSSLLSVLRYLKLKTSDLYI